MFDRSIFLIGIDNFKKIQDAKILLLGVGGVGGYVLEALIRSGILHMTIIDGDVVEESNLNRQLVALTSTIGQAKVDVMKRRLAEVNPGATINTINEFVEAESIDKLELEKYDYVIDCIDDLDVKVELAKRSLEKKFKLISAMGTARKLEPQKLLITTLDKTCYDPLAKRMRQALKGYKTSEIKVLTSTEEPITCEDGALGSMVFVPGAAGLLIANYVIRNIISIK